VTHRVLQGYGYDRGFTVTGHEGMGTVMNFCTRKHTANRHGGMVVWRFSNSILRV
jgi:hypothetical protein